MNKAMLIQTLVIALVVGWSVLSAAHRLLPVATRRAQARIADAFARPSLPAWLRVFALRLQPKSTAGASCGDGCSACGGCAVADAKPEPETLPLAFRPRTKA